MTAFCLCLLNTKSISPHNSNTTIFETGKEFKFNKNTLLHSNKCVFYQMFIDTIINNDLHSLRCLYIQVTEANNLNLVTFLGIWNVLERTGGKKLLWLMYTP